MLCGTCCLLPSVLALCCILDFGMRGGSWLAAALKKAMPTPDRSAYTQHNLICASDQPLAPVNCSPSELEIHNPRMIEVQTLTNLQFI